MRMIKIVAVMLALLLLAGGTSLAVAPQAAETEAGLSAKAKESYRQSVRSLDLQTSLPEKKELKAPALPGPFIPAWVAYICLALALAVVAWVIFAAVRDNMSQASHSRRIKRPDSHELSPAAIAGRMETAHSSAEELARLGDFAQAMHVLLLQSVNELRCQLDISIAVSLTSREILAMISLGPKARGAFADIIDRVEVSYFGRHVPDEEDYQACRSDFESLTDALKQGRTV